MFDANADHIKCGELFFAEVHSVDMQLSELGVNCGDILLCRHTKKNTDKIHRTAESEIWLSKGSDPVIYDSNSTGCVKGWAWLVYSGRPDGNGFINDAWKSKALNFMGGEWKDEEQTS